MPADRKQFWVSQIKKEPPISVQTENCVTSLPVGTLKYIHEFSPPSVSFPLSLQRLAKDLQSLQRLAKDRLPHGLCPPSLSQFAHATRTLVRGGPTRPHRPRLVASHSTRPLSSLSSRAQLLHRSCSNKQQRLSTYTSSRLSGLMRTGGKHTLQRPKAWVAKEKIGTLLLASEMPVPIPRSRTVHTLSLIHI